MAMIFCCWIFFAFRVPDHIPKFRFIDILYIYIHTQLIISISTNNSMLPVNKHQNNVSASCFGERKTCCGCKVEFLLKLQLSIPSAGKMAGLDVYSFRVASVPGSRVVHFSRIWSEASGPENVQCPQNPKIPYNSWDIYLPTCRWIFLW